MSLYTYRATVVAVTDGDTLRLTADLGFHTDRRDCPYRIAGISARELHDPGGREAAANLLGLLPPGTQVTIRSYRTGYDPETVMSLGRYVVMLELPDGRNLADVLIVDGWAVAWDGRSKPTPVPPWPRAPISSAGTGGATERIDQ